MSESELVPRSAETMPKTKLSPFDRRFADLPPGKYFKLTEVAEILGVSPAWLRRRIGKYGLKAPSLMMPQGSAPPAYIYTAEDVQELKQLKDRPQEQGLVERE